ncbi:MAG: hypothetical protein IH795_09715, partial [Bacteroidetes bacterium]|nr:hypothetical protein [Bacteroidota bacterium]
MSTLSIDNKLWIKNPLSDSVYFSFGWIVVFLALVLFQSHMGLIIVIVLLFNYVHRHYTMALVYGQKEEFDKRKQVYIYLPIIAIIVTALSIYFKVFPYLLTLSVLWTMYHSVAQKYGFTRIYSRKAGYGKGWIDKGILYSWFFYLFFAMIIYERSTLLKYKAGRVIVGNLNNYMDYISTLSYALLAVSIVFTLIYVYEEIKNRKQISIPKNIFVVSTLSIYAIFFQSMVVGYIVFGFSHAIEYIAFVNIFVGAKYRKKPESNTFFSRVSKRQWLYSGLFSVVIVVLSLIGMKIDQNAFLIYIVGSSFLHYIY